MSFWDDFGAGLDKGSSAAIQLAPLWLKGEENRVAAENAEAAKKAYNDGMNPLLEKWNSLQVVNPAKEAYKEVMGGDPDQMVNLENEEQVKGAAKMMETVANNRPVDTNTQIAGGALPAQPATQPISPQAPAQASQPTAQYDYSQQPELFDNALVEQESGGHGYDSPDGPPTRHGKALGKYQIMPKFWFEKIGLDPNSEADKKKFRESPELQDKLFGIVKKDALQKAGGNPWKAALVYYSGSPNPSNIDKVPQPGMPTPREYANQLVSKMGLNPADFGGDSVLTGPGTSTSVSGSIKAPANGAVTSMLRKEVLKGPPVEERLRDDYLKKIKSIQESPEFIRAPANVKKDFLENVVKPYQNTADYARTLRKDHKDSFEKRVTEWGKNARVMARAEITAAYRKSKSQGQRAIGGLLSKIQTRIREIDRFKSEYSRANEKRKSELLKQFSEYSKTQEETGIFAWVKDLFGDTPMETVIDNDKLERLRVNLDNIEKELINQLKGAGGTFFEGVTDEVPVDEGGFGSGDDDLDATISDDED